MWGGRAFAAAGLAGTSGFSAAMTAATTGSSAGPASAALAFLGIVFRHGAQGFRHYGLGHMFSEKLLDLREFAVLFFRDECDGRSGGFRAGGTSDPVNIILAVVRHVIVDDEFNMVYVDSPAEDIRGHIRFPGR